VEEGHRQAITDSLPVRSGARVLPGVAWFALSRQKRALDLLVACVGLILGAPLFLLVGLAVRMDSPGAVLFRQERIGLGGQTFTCLKFRTMTQGADDTPHRTYIGRMISAPERSSPVNGMYKLADDPRVTRVGRIIRRMSLDELPQLVNVLRGEMSIVGPRPALDYEVALYQDWQLDRLRMKPGLTGLWQVSGRNLLTYEEMCRLDIAYADGWSLARDIAIILRTPMAMLHPGRSA
jgi:lipopolysaccharide/colanic/teichoic acid biosynthesis glycosyltransferase